MSTVSSSLIKACLSLTQAISRAESPDDIYTAALDSLAQALTVTRAAVLLFDPDGVMRFKAWRGLSGTYRAAVEGHSPWAPDTRMHSRSSSATSPSTGRSTAFERRSPPRESPR